MSKIDIGIKKQDRIKITEGLKRLLADSYTLYLQTHNFHWNVTGPLTGDGPTIAVPPGTSQAGAGTNQIGGCQSHADRASCVAP